MINVYQAKRFCKEDISKIKNYDKAVAVLLFGVCSKKGEI